MAARINADFTTVRDSHSRCTIIGMHISSHVYRELSAIQKADVKMNGKPREGEKRTKEWSAVSHHRNVTDVTCERLMYFIRFSKQAPLTRERRMFVRKVRS